MFPSTTSTRGLAETRPLFRGTVVASHGRRVSETAMMLAQDRPTDTAYGIFMVKTDKKKIDEIHWVC